VQLTHAGQKLVTQARTLVEEWEKIRSDVLRDEEEIRGRYTIGCHPAVALFSLPLFMAKLLSEHPHLEVKLVHDLSRKIAEDVISFKIDFGIVVNPWEHPDLIIKPLWKDEVGLYTAKKPSALQDPNSGEAVLIADTDLIQSQTILKQLAKGKVRYKRLITTSSLEVIAGLVAERAGLGILPGRVAGNILGYDVKPVKDGPIFHDQIAIVFRADAQRSRANRTLAKLMETALIPDKAG
jgi:DNA-binding transcriptional LysR family regulator